MRGKNIYQENVLQIDIKHVERYKDPLNGIFCLHGPHNTGKSTSLGWFIFLLCYHGKTEPEIQAIFDDYLKRQKRRKYPAFPDTILIIPYNDKYVYVSTQGDSIISVEESVLFFKGILINSKVKIFRNGRFEKLLNSEADYYSHFPPSVCVTACYEGEAVELPMRYFFELKHRVTFMCNALKMCNSEGFVGTYRKYGNYLKKLTDDCLTFCHTSKNINNQNINI